MTARDIELFRKSIENAARNANGIFPSQTNPFGTVDMQQPSFTMLCEIAHQMAIANEQKTSTSLIELHTTKGEPFLVHKDEITFLVPRGSCASFVPRGGTECDDTHYVSETYEEVCAKLGVGKQ